MYTIIYDPMSTQIVDPDGKTANRAQSIADDIQTNPNNSITVANELIIHHIRLLTIKGIINHTHIQFCFNNQTIQINQHGQLDIWPNGFCDYFDKIFNKLLIL